MSTRPTVLALAAHPSRAGATRFRLTQMLPYFEARGWNVRFEPFVDDDFLTDFYKQGGSLRKALHLAGRSLRRVVQAVQSGDVDVVFLQREAALIGPPYMEFILRTLQRVPIVFDFDDALWELNLQSSAHPLAARLLKDPNKCWSNMRHATRVIAGSEYLRGRAEEFNPNVTVVPTVVSANEWTPLPGRLDGEFAGSGPVRLGWVGMHTTAPQLELVAPALERLRAEGYEFQVDVVGAAEGFRLGSIELNTRPWALENEVSDFQHIDIGLAPLHSGPVFEGKCGFKQLQYMAVGVPFVSSWVGGVRDFVADGENGLVAHDAEDWYQHLRLLLESRDLRKSLARAGRDLVERNYCAERQGPRVADVLEQVLAQN